MWPWNYNELEKKIGRLMVLRKKRISTTASDNIWIDFEKTKKNFEINLVLFFAGRFTKQKLSILIQLNEYINIVVFKSKKITKNTDALNGGIISYRNHYKILYLYLYWTNLNSFWKNKFINNDGNKTIIIIIAVHICCSENIWLNIDHTIGEQFQ